MTNKYSDTLAKIEYVLLKSISSCEEAAWQSAVFDRQDDLSAELLKPIADLLKRGGKRWRPLLMALSCEALGGGDAALALSPLLEFCHNASLIHDDIEDSSDMRRGKPAIHKIYGLDTAINSGTFLYFLPLICIDKWDAAPDFKLKLYKLWSQNMRRLHLGQSMDITWHKDRSFFPSTEQYFEMCALKTGVLAKFAVLCGSLAAQNTIKLAIPADFYDKTMQLANAAEKMGVAFQILDDVKNIRAGVKGKTFADDIVEGKKSLPVLIFVTASGNKLTAIMRRKLVGDCMGAAARGGAKAGEVNVLVEELESSGATTKAYEQAKSMLSDVEKTFKTAGGDIFEGFFDIIA
ncbi:MAG: polyprenyl synthetase family protein [Termitinemataceae bacterium]|nr:MAG: polyprenyl synthetase family protein [Termitinemataceae bacterium]